MGNIQYLNRSTGKVEVEDVYGEKWLRFTYERSVGKFFLWSLVKRKLFSSWYGALANRKKSKEKILPFIQKFKVDEKEFLAPTESFLTFNEFFHRKLKKSSRPISSDEKSIVFPADGRHLGFQNISKMERIFVKGQEFNLPKLFDSIGKASKYEDGTLVISRLCPVDYHRFHFPYGGNFKSPHLINGNYLSVNPIALRKNIAIFWENKRSLSFIESENLGQIAIFAVGATCVGTIHYSSEIERVVKKGDELGYFAFGGSCILTFFEKNKVTLSDDLVNASRNGIELYAKMGEEMGFVKDRPT